MAGTRIDQKVQYALWARSAGRCQFRNCPEVLTGDLLSNRADGKFGYVAHVIGDVPKSKDGKGGPRYDPVRSAALAGDIANLMLLCGRHHKLIDVDAKDDYPEEVLLGMKAEQEARVLLLTGITPDRASHVLRFAANIGANQALVSRRELWTAMVPDHYPDNDGRSIDLDLPGFSPDDGEALFWDVHQANLRRQFLDHVRGRIERQDIRHLSVFALAPQPLLIELGRLLGDIVPMSVHQRHREPQTWSWQPDQPSIEFVIGEPPATSGIVALKLAVSAPVDDERIRAVLGPDVAIWSVDARTPHNDVMRRPEDLSSYRRLLRSLYDRIKGVHGEKATVNLFPVVPASVAIETGRVWMPKAHLPMVVFDQNWKRGGFAPTLRIAHM